MVQNGYLGVACEPNCVFFVCNQFPILGFRFEDVRKGTDVAGEVTAEYLKAWQAKGLVSERGLYPDFWQVAQDNVVPGRGPAGTNWANAIMNAWNSDFVRSMYDRQIKSLFPVDPDGRARWFGRNREGVASVPLPPYGAGSLIGFTAMVLSEMADARLNDLLDYADHQLNPTWERGGLYYPRHDELLDAEGRFAAMDTLTGNALLGYARLNVCDGLRTLYQRPWSSAHFAQPKIQAVTGCELSTATFDSKLGRLAARLAPRRGADPTGETTVSFDLNKHQGSWSLYADHRLVASNSGPEPGFSTVLKGSEIQVQPDVRQETELVLLIG
jgi:hypothetical protein